MSITKRILQQKIRLWLAKRIMWVDLDYFVIEYAKTRLSLVKSPFRDLPREQALELQKRGTPSRIAKQKERRAKVEQIETLVRSGMLKREEGDRKIAEIVAAK